MYWLLIWNSNLTEHSIFDLAILLTSYQPPGPHGCFSNTQAQSRLRTFALAGASAWITFLGLCFDQLAIFWFKCHFREAFPGQYVKNNFPIPHQFQRVVFTVLIMPCNGRVIVCMFSGFLFYFPQLNLSITRGKLWSGPPQYFQCLHHSRCIGLSWFSVTINRNHFWLLRAMKDFNK